MDFFSEQDQARRSTKRLVFLFLLAVMTLIIITNIIAAFTFFLMDEKLVGNYQAYQNATQTLSYQATKNLGDYFSWQQFGKISAIVTGVIACAMLFKWLQLAGGGKNVAEQLGGARVHPNTNNPQQQQLLNVVEEMALAANMPVPAVYLLAQESGINAFAAGSTPADAVIGVTQGSLDKFGREQLQGVIAHEFSHILNGDMRLNIRLIAILHGILFIGFIGRMIVRMSSGYGHRGFHSRSNRRGDGRLAIFGFALLVIGWLGMFFGNWIKSAVSRQREFLADASAVQFTRNPNGIADALKVIGGHSMSTTLETPNAEQMSHLFFGQAISSLSRLFATHPPLQERIQRIEPNWNGKFITQQMNETAPDSKATDSNKDSIKDALVTATILAAAADQQIEQNTTQASLQSISPLVTAQIHEPLGATAIVFALLMSNIKGAKEKQLSYIDQTHIKGLKKLTLQLHAGVAELEHAARLPLLELTFPALKCMSAQQYKIFCRTLLLLIRADQKFELSEWCFYQLLRHYLDPEFGHSKPSRALYKNANDIGQQYALVLSLLIHQGETDRSKTEQAFNRGANTAGLYNLKLLDKESCQLDDFVKATRALANCYPLLKPRLLKGLANAAKHDGTIHPTEYELLTAIAAIMDSPLPSMSFPN